MLDINEQEIKIISGQHNITDDFDQQWIASLLFGLLFDYSYTLDDMVASLSAGIKVTPEKAKAILLDGAYLYFSKLAKDKQAEVETWFAKYNFDKARAKAELTMDKGGLINMATLYYAEADSIAEEILDLFTNNLILVLTAQDEENQRELNDRLMFLLLYWEQAAVFKEKLLSAITKNTDYLSKAKLKIGEKLLEPTAVNWLSDFSAHEVLVKDLTINKKVAYFNGSVNFKNLSEAEKIIVSGFLDLIWRLKFFPQNVPNKNYNDWYIVPFHQEEDKKFSENIAAAPAVKSGNNLGAKTSHLAELYQQKLANLTQRYRLTENLPAWLDKSQLELVNAIETATRAEVVLPALISLVKKSADLTLLTKSSGLQKISGAKNPKIEEALKVLLLSAGLNDEDSAVFMMRLAKDNPALAGLTYGDLKSLTFKWR